MKKFVLVLLVLFLILPAISSKAGSVSSRYDVTFGGFVKFDAGWSSQNASADPNVAARSSTSQYAVYADEYSNTFMTSGETRFNFLVKGPDLWGAKTAAFIEGDFRGVTTGNAYGAFQIRHAWMKLKWPGQSELMIGQDWQQWGMPYYGAWLGCSDFTQSLRGIRTPQIAWRYFFTKEFNTMLGLTAATNPYGATRQFNDGYARSNWPGLMGEIAYWTDRFGKIGSNNMKFAIGGYYGRDKESYNDPTNAAKYKDDTINAWVTAFRYSVPVIPEKKGNKQMALLLNGNFFIGQNVGGNNWMNTTASNGSYLRPNNDATAPTLFGLFAQASWWVTNNLSFNGMYGYLKYNYSEYGRGALDNAAAGGALRRNMVNMEQSYAVNLLWDANQAVRFGIEWYHMFTSYNGKNAPTGRGPGLADSSGTIDLYRVAAWYFF